MICVVLPRHCSQGSASKWSASRIRTEVEDKFDAIKTAKEGLPVLLTGEVEYKESHFIYFYYSQRIFTFCIIITLVMCCLVLILPHMRKLILGHTSIIKYSNTVNKVELWRPVAKHRLYNFIIINMKSFKPFMSLQLQSAYAGIK